jgi:hypothetical protein
VIAVSDSEADSEADLSAENNFLRFKKEINHALPGQSFFRINFNQPHPDHGKGGVLRPLGHEVVQPASTFVSHQGSRTSSNTKLFKSTLTSSNILPYESRRIQVTPKTEQRKENKYEKPSSTKIVNGDSQNEYKVVYSESTTKESTPTSEPEVFSNENSFRADTKGKLKFELVLNSSYRNVLNLFIIKTNPNNLFRCPILQVIYI